MVYFCSFRVVSQNTLTPKNETMPILICLIMVLLGASPIVASPIVITEIHHSPADGNLSLEFIELHNRSEASISLSDWKLTKGIQYTFPKGTVLEGGAYLVVSKEREAFRNYFELKSNKLILGPFKGRLDGEGECLVLKNAFGKEMDRVNYKNKKTWAYCKGELRTSLQLINPAFDNRIGQYWEAAKPSPCQINSTVFTTHLLPIIKHIDQYPQAPKSNEIVTVVANVRNAQQVELWYQVVAPGKYIALADSAYQANWLVLPMKDDGKEGDAVAKDRIYSIQLPRKLQQHRHLIRYKIIAKGDSISIAPRQSQPQPNFAYYTYDNLPAYKGYSFDSLNKLPVCQLIAKAEDVQYLIYEYKKRAYSATGTIVYNGVVYDHIGYRSRGYNNRHSRVKRNLKFNFHNNQKIEVLNSQGLPYAVRRKKMVLSGGWLLGNPNTHGLSESVLYRLFALQGASASYADYMHLRVVKNAEESDSLEGDFWGLYLMLENYDGDFLETHDLPDANIYSYKPFKIRHQTHHNTLAQKQNYVHWDSSCYQRNPMEWWTKTIDWENYMGFLIVNELLANKESGYRKQHWWTEYRHDQKGWQFFPWDVDKTWTSSRIKSTISSGIFEQAFQHKKLEQAYKNQLRSVLDLLFNEEQLFQLIEEEAAAIYQPNLSYSFVDLDKLRWGQDYEGGFETQIAVLKRFVQRRRAYILNEILKDSIPETPEIAYKGNLQFAVDSLQFKALGFNTKTTQKIQWHIAEVTKNKQLISLKTDPKIYEIVTKWKREFAAALGATLSLPLGAVQPSKNYRIRVRVQDTRGYYSHWSEPIEFVPTKVKTNYGNELVINELLYQSKDGLEFIEIHNPSDKAINLAHFKFSKGISFEFPDDAVLAAGGYCVLTNKLSLFQEKYGFVANGTYQGKLSNKGEKLLLYNAFDELIDSVRYKTYKEGEMEECTALELVYARADNALASNWTCAATVFGTPGKINSVFSQKTPWSPNYWLAFLILFLGLLGYGFQKRAALLL